MKRILFVFCLASCTELTMDSDSKKNHVVETKAQSETRRESRTTPISPLIAGEVLIHRYVRKSEIGRPVITEATYSYGSFEILDECLIFTTENNGQIGVPLFFGNPSFSNDMAAITIFEKRVEFGKQYRVNGVVRGRYLDNDDVVPPIPNFCPKETIIIGGIE